MERLSLGLCIVVVGPILVAGRYLQAAESWLQTVRRSDIAMSPSYATSKTNTYILGPGHQGMHNEANPPHDCFSTLVRTRQSILESVNRKDSTYRLPEPLGATSFVSTC